MSEEIRAWWDKCHKDNSKVYLSESRGKNIWGFLNIGPLLGPSKTVLDVGVGFGYATRDLLSKGCIVHALDISQLALDRVKDFAVCWLAPKQLKELPENTFDLAISHLVAQHMSNENLLEQMAAIIRTLKPNGVFAMQFAFLVTKSGMIADELREDMEPKKLLNVIYNRLMKEGKRDVFSQTHGAICRSLEEMSQLVSQANGEIVWVTKKMFPNLDCGWHGVHIKRKVMK